jgi:hypothetical protein
VVRHTRRDADYLTGGHDALQASNAETERAATHREPIGLVRVHMLGFSFRTGRTHALENEPRTGGRACGFNEPDALPGAGVYDLLSDLGHVAAPSSEVVALGFLLRVWVSAARGDVYHHLPPRPKSCAD